MKILLDTSLVVRLAEPGTPLHVESRDILRQLKRRGHELMIVPQVLYEYWAVATRPLERNGLGRSPAQCAVDLTRLTRIFKLLRDERTVFEQWQRLVEAHGVRGKNSHDARLVAAMQRHQIRGILTLNPTDFSRYPEIVVDTPSTMLERLARQEATN